MRVGVITLDDLFHQLALPITERPDLAMRGRRQEAMTRT
jgi:hypothetical protein